ncbi:hypothetical protein O3M35_004599 [Rhynocoris fuscipes]|uniref:Uncharacterized protein n=1 Tax=Rhynocoris fuscipes TaxID=488301 RepID=A0AAW1CG98_9HEMI
MTSNVLLKVRTFMKQYKLPLQAVIITNHDQHSSEYLAERDRILKYVSGFSGSAGTAIITDKDAKLWTDGRYFLQANREMDSSWSLMKVGVFGTLSEGTWLTKNLASGSYVGSDPKLMPYSVWSNLEKELSSSGIKLIPIEDYMDQIWLDRPPLVSNPIKVLDIKYAGVTSSAKIGLITKAMKEKSVDCLVLSALDDISWLLNLRGDDIAYNPVFFSFLVIRPNGLHLFVDDKKLTNDVKIEFDKENLGVSILPYGEIYNFLRDIKDRAEKVWLCRSANQLIYSIIPENKRLCECSPVSLLKAIKNETEVKGMVSAHIKDGVALCRYFHWLENTIMDVPITEISAAKVLEQFRKEEEGYVGPSFPTISSSGPNAAIIHYIPDKHSDRHLVLNEIYLCDSGAQYLDGTTDVTRTVHFSTPSEFERECFTRVVKGVIALASTKFPYGIKGNCLDSFARKALWEVGLDYKHGTGHGIGSYLFVHEGPMGISWRPFPDDPGLQPNMFLSDEPGYYHDGEFGIRIENIVQIISAKTMYNMPVNEKGFLTFDTITLCPIQIKFLNTALLNDFEITFINSYHKKVFDTIGPLLLKRGLTDVHKWLEKETAEIKI